MMGGSTWCGLVLAVVLSWISTSDNCKYPNLNMKFDIRKIVEPKTCTGLPRINGIMKNITANIGEKVEFDCDVDYTCMVNSIRWYHTTPDNLTTTQLKVEDRHQYTILAVTEDHEGRYTCAAENVLGQTDLVSYLTVNNSQRLRDSLLVVVAVMAMAVLT